MRTRSSGRRRSACVMVLRCALLPLVLAGSTQSVPANDRPAPLFDDLGTHHAPITTTDPEAQRYFDQGLILSYGFNHAEAVRSFRAAQQLDPNCAMCFWGEAYALGPNINKPMDPADAPAAWQAISRARTLGRAASPRETALIEAMAARYSAEALADRSELDAAYAAAMASVVESWPDDLDAATLYAEALMDLMPWDYYTADGKARPRTEEVTAVLESILARNPEHPGAIHFYIHAVEASSTPARAEAGADRLGALVPGSGHLVHMPSHIYLRLGRYSDASRVNELAAAADESYISQCRAQGFYPALYYPHNVHFLWYTASLEGRKNVALTAARKLADNVPVDLVSDVPLIEQFLAVPFFGLVRFGDWEGVLAEAEPRTEHRFARAIWHASRSLAFSATGHGNRAMQERSMLGEIAAGFDADAFATYGYPVDTLLSIAGHIADAGIAAVLDKDKETIEYLEQAVALEDGLPYMEPPYWFFPVRQLLGAAFEAQQRYAQAAETYREDLRRIPLNGWSLHGLRKSLEALGDTPGAQSAAAQFSKAWKDSDFDPETLHYF